MEHYISEIKRYGLLSREDEARLARLANEGNEKARDRLINSNLLFVIKTANKYRNYGVSLPDLVQEGTLGLMRAVEKFDPYLGNRLITYAVWYIKAYMRNLIVRSWSMVKVGTTKSQRKMFFALNPKYNKMSIGERKPTIEELAKEFSVEIREVEEMNSILKFRDFSVNSMAYPGKTSSSSSIDYVDTMPSNSPLLDEEYSNNEKNVSVRTELWKAMHDLDKRECYIIRNRLMADEPKTHEEVGLKLSISRQRVGQIEERLIKKLRVVFENTNLRPAA